MKHFFITLFVKLTSRKFWVWLVTTYITYSLLIEDGEHEWFIPLVIVWGVVSFVYLCGEVLIDAIAKAVEKAEIKVGK
jgi:hypothetical protein